MDFKYDKKLGGLSWRLPQAFFFTAYRNVT